MVDVITEPAGPQSQPIEALAHLDPVLDDAKVREAIVHAEANNLDPQTMTLQDMAQVPQKFLKSDGTADVDKIKTSTEALDAAIQKKEEALKTVDDYMREYRERESKNSSLPNAQKTLAQIPPAPQPSQQQPENFEEIVRRDWQTDPLMTTTRLIDMALQQRFQPLEAREKSETIRSNLQSLASKDPRVMREDVFAAINAKLANDPDLWKLKNPHRTAWLEVKEELRLGEPSSVPAQPSRPLSPVLGGGSPPSVPSSSVPASSKDVFANLNSLDLRDKKQEAMGDAAIREMLVRE